MRAVLAALVAMVAAPAVSLGEEVPASAGAEASDPGPRAPEEPTGSSTGAGPALERSGRHHLGLALEVPIVGVTVGVRGARDTSAGYTLGAALAWEILPTVLVRGYGAMGQAYGARPDISYSSQVLLEQRPQEAIWLGWELGGGVAYLFRSPRREWTPYVGADAAAVFGGYEYVFASDDPLTEDGAAAETSTGGASQVNEALEWSWLAGVRAGVRLSLLDWLATQAEISVSYWSAPSGAVTNTFTERQVKSVADEVFLVRATFGVRLGI